MIQTRTWPLTWSPSGPFESSPALGPKNPLKIQKGMLKNCKKTSKSPLIINLTLTISDPIDLSIMPRFLNSNYLCKLQSPLSIPLNFFNPNYGLKKFLDFMLFIQITPPNHIHFSQLCQYFKMQATYAITPLNPINFFNPVDLSLLWLLHHLFKSHLPIH